MDIPEPLVEALALLVFALTCVYWRNILHFLTSPFRWLVNIPKRARQRRERRQAEAYRQEQERLAAQRERAEALERQRQLAEIRRALEDLL